MEKEEEEKECCRQVATQWLVENGKDVHKFTFVFPELQSCPEGAVTFSITHSLIFNNRLQKY
jgi:hypothetical protein